MRRLLATWQHFSLLARPLLHSLMRELTEENHLRHMACSVEGDAHKLNEYIYAMLLLVIDNWVSHTYSSMLCCNTNCILNRKKTVMTQTNQSSWFIGRSLIRALPCALRAPFESRSHLQGPRTEREIET